MSRMIRLLLLTSFLLALVTTNLTQDHNPQIVWKNVETRYENIRDIKPSVELKDADYVTWKFLPSSNLLYRYDEDSKRWVVGNYVLDDIPPSQRQTLVLEKAKPIDYFFKPWSFFDWDSKSGCFFLAAPEYQAKRYPVEGRYKIVFFYGTKLSKPDVLDSFSESPEFSIAPNPKDRRFCNILGK